MRADDSVSITFLLQIGLNVKSLLLSLVSMQMRETRCFKTKIFSNFPKIDFDTIFI